MNGHLEKANEGRRKQSECKSLIQESEELRKSLAPFVPKPKEKSKPKLNPVSKKIFFKLAYLL